MEVLTSTSFLGVVIAVNTILVMSPSATDVAPLAKTCVKEFVGTVVMIGLTFVSSRSPD